MGIRIWYCVWLLGVLLLLVLACYYALVIYHIIVGIEMSKCIILINFSLNNQNSILFSQDKDTKPFVFLIFFTISMKHIENLSAKTNEDNISRVVQSKSELN